MYNFIDETSTVDGTVIDRRAMMAVQGFFGNRVVFNDDGSITETNADGHTKTTVFDDDGNVVETFVADGLTIAKKTTFNSDGTIDEVLL